MTVRKCIYTGKDSDAKDRVLPDNPFNWTNNVPTTKEYKNGKKNDFPTELEMQANEIFHLLELAKNRVLFYEKKLIDIQGKIQEKPEKPQNDDLSMKKEVKKTTTKVLKRDKEIKQAIKEKEILEESEKIIKKVLDKKATLWD